VHWANRWNDKKKGKNSGMVKSLRVSLSRRMKDVVLRTGRRFYLYLAIFLSVVAVVDLTASQLIKGIYNSTFDWLMQNRLKYPLPDKEIVIIDIDEASLRELSGTLGRWPWPRRVMGQMVEALEAQGAKAIVLDVLFSSPDLADPKSDQYLAQVLTRYRNVYVPALLLNDLDAKPIKLAQVPFAEKALPEARDDEQAVISLPYFADKVAPGQLGLGNAYPDDDGVIRRFRVSPARGGWRVSSLPMQLAKAMGYPVTAGDNRLINWRGPPFSFRRVSFSRVYSSVLAGNGASLSKDFRGKIVLIGSTAVGLFDAKASPMASVHPGVEILATVIDNLKNRNFIHEQPDWVYVGVAILLIWVLAFAFRNRRGPRELDTLFIGLQVIFVLFAFLALSASEYIDLATPIMFGMIYFFIARPYASYESHLHANRAVVASRLDTGAQYRFAAMAIRPVDLKKAELRALQNKLDRLIESSALGAGKLDHLFAERGYIADLFNQTALIYWLVPEVEGGSTRRDIEADATRIIDGLSQTIPESKASGTGCLRSGFRDRVVLWNGGEPYPSYAREAVLWVLRELDAKNPEPLSHVTASDKTI
jgi:CHASE2 domain-containing sensor protein